MENVLILGISGKRRSGKNLSCDLISAKYHKQEERRCNSVKIQHTAFANPLKEFVSIVTGEPIYRFNTNEGKNRVIHSISPLKDAIELFQTHFFSVFQKIFKQDDIQVSREKFFALYSKTRDLVTQRIDAGDMTFGILLQIAGTDIFREMEKNFWVSFLIYDLFGDIGYLSQMVTDFSRPWNRIVIITDVRFPNEADFVKDNRGFMLRINRMDCYRLGDSDKRDDKHPSETALDHYERFDMINENNESIQHLEEGITKHMQLLCLMITV